MAVGFAVVCWIVFCASLTLILGSGAERYPADTEGDFSEPLFIAGVACFAVGALGALILKLTGATNKRQEDGETWGLGFLLLTALLALIAGIVIDVLR